MDLTIHNAALALVAARSSNRPIAALPQGCAPVDIAAAYRIQDATLDVLGKVGGWKVSVGKAPEICAPIHDGVIYASGGSLSGLAMWDSALEVEIGAMFGRDLPARRQPYSASEVGAAIAGLHATFEVTGSRFIDKSAVSALSVIADMQSNAALVVGGAVAAWRDLELADMAPELRIDGQDVAGRPGKAATTGQVLDSLAWLANHAAQRGRSLRAGQIVLTGARLMFDTIRPGVHAEAVLPGIGRVAVQFKLEWGRTAP